MSLRNIRIRNLSKVAYDCLVQQLMILCFYYHGEYWKMFLDVKLDINNVNAGNFGDLVLKKDYIESMKKYYGISIVEFKEKMTFEEEEIYLVSLNSEVYPLFISSIENQVEHSFLIYGETLDKYIVNDNYYEKTEFYIDKEIIDQYALKIFKVKKSETQINSEEIKKKVIDIVDDEFENKWELFCTKISTSRAFEAADILVAIKKICEYLDVGAKIMLGYSESQSYINECGKLLQENASKINALYYAVLKEYIKNEKIRGIFLDKKMHQLSCWIKIEKNIKEEIYNSLLDQKSYLVNFKSQIESFLEYQINDTKRLDEDGIDQYILLALLSYLELENNIIDMDFMLFNIEDTYREFLFKVCKYMLVESNVPKYQIV